MYVVSATLCTKKGVGIRGGKKLVPMKLVYCKSTTHYLRLALIEKAFSKTSLLAYFRPSEKPGH